MTVFISTFVLILISQLLITCKGKKKEKEKEKEKKKSAESAESPEKDLLYDYGSPISKTTTPKSSKIPIKGDVLNSKKEEEKEKDKKEEEPKDSKEKSKRKQDEPNEENKDDKEKDKEKKDDKKEEKKEENKDEKEEKKEDKKEDKEEEKEKENEKDEKLQTYITAEPSGELQFRRDLISQTRVVLTNNHTEKVMFKIKFSKNDAFKVNPVYGTIEPGKTCDLAVTHNKSSCKEAKMVVVNTVCTTTDEKANLAKSFKTAKIKGAPVKMKLNVK